MRHCYFLKIVLAKTLLSNLPSGLGKTAIIRLVIVIERLASAA